jgi:hypothetical protein
MAYAPIIDAKNQNAQAFYRHYDFAPFLRAKPLIRLFFTCRWASKRTLGADMYRQ